MNNVTRKRKIFIKICNAVFNKHRNYILDDNGMVQLQVLWYLQTGSDDPAKSLEKMYGNIRNEIVYADDNYNGWRESVEKKFKRNKK